MNTTFRRSWDFRSLSAAKLSQLHLLLLIRSHQKMTGLQHRAAADRDSVVREEVGEVDITEKEVDGSMVEGEIVVPGVVSSLSRCSLIRGLTTVSTQLTVVGETVNTEDMGKVREENLHTPASTLILGLGSSGYRRRGDGEWRGRGDGERRGRGDGEWRGRGDGEWRGRGDGKKIAIPRSRLAELRLIRLFQASEVEERDTKVIVDEEMDMKVTVDEETATKVIVEEETGMRVIADETATRVTVVVGGDEVMSLFWKRRIN
jgi:hypothetical protein